MTNNIVKVTKFESQNLTVWTFPQEDIEVAELPFDNVLHRFGVFKTDGYHLGDIYPADIESMNSCIDALNSGESPIAGRWEDGRGNACTMEGWKDLS